MIVYDTLTPPISTAVDYDDIVNSDVLKLPDYDVATERNYIEILIKSACDDAEKYLNRKLVYQEIALRSDDVCDRYYLPYGALRSVESVIIYDLNNSPVDQDGKYTAITGERGQVFLNETESWDYGAGARRYMPFEINFFCGWDKEYVPSSIKDMILSMITFRYYNRETTNYPPEILGKGSGYKIMSVT